ncbi:putative transmembrane protein 161AB [Popillia japonica]|uniref:Transmembrane protein 161AB n=1 Tax=Popillia japonica TaxID=7064 RepID=A0AAW1JIJ6_POPJA
MALLGAQLVITLLMISVIQKLGPYFSFAKWILCSQGLVRYLYPSDAELKQIANIPKDKQKAKRNKLQQNGKIETFHVPRNIDIKLKFTKVSVLDVIHLRFYTEYQWLIDFSIYTVIVYMITEMYHSFFPLKEEINLSMMWCSLVVIFAIKTLFSLTVQYFKSDESEGERSTCLVMGLSYFLMAMMILIVDENTLELGLETAYSSFNSYFLMAMMILIVDENTLELGLETAYSSFNSSASNFLTKQGLSTSGPASKLIIKFFLAVCGGILGALFTFPGLRIAKMHYDLLKRYQKDKLQQFILNVSFILPFFLVIAWLKPIARNYLTVRIFSGMTNPLLTEDAFNALRLIVTIAVMCWKVMLMPSYMQAYLNMAVYRIEEQKKEAGRITNVDLQKKVGAVFYYLCVVSLQYMAPVVMVIFFTLMYKTLGEFSWNGFMIGYDTEKCSIPKVAETIISDDQSIKKSAQQFHLALENLKSIFTTEVFRGLFGFGTWWCCFLYFATTSVGMVYHSYFTDTY